MEPKANEMSASNSPSEEAAASEAQPTSVSSDSEGLQSRLGLAEFSGARALTSFLKRTSTQLEESAGRFSSMLRELKSNDGMRQIAALTELSEYLSFSSEEALIALPMETLIPLLMQILEDPHGSGDETAAQAMLLSCRCLFNVVDILPPTTRIVTAAGGLPLLCQSLLNVEYIDVAELAIAIMERISEDHPLQVLKAGGLQAILTFLDFFQMAVQRQAANAAALMLLPTPPAEVFEQHVRPVLPTLAELLQHADPQVLQSICECWRRLLDNAIVLNGGKGRLVGVLEDMCPSNVLSHLLMMLGNGISSPSPHSAVITAEVLYIVAVLTNASDAFTEEVLQGGVSVVLKRMVTSMQLSSHGGVSSQTNLALVRVLVAVASILPMVQLVDRSCVCDEKRLKLLKVNAEHLDALGEVFLPLTVETYETCMEPSTQSLCVTLLLSFFLACRERPQVIKKSLDATRLACFLANLLVSHRSRSAQLACLLIVHELLERHPMPYSLLFVRHGVVRAVHRLVTHEDEPHRRTMPNKGSGQQKQRGKAAQASNLVGQVKLSPGQLVDDVAQRVLASYFASSSTTGESAILRVLGKIAKQLRSSPTELVAAHREALSKLHDLLLTSDGITAFEFSCSGAANALNAFLFPLTFRDDSRAASYSERLQLFLECIGRSSRGAFVKLVRLSVAALQRIEQQPLMLFPTHSSLMAALPPHFRDHRPQVAGKGRGPAVSSGDHLLAARQGRNSDGQGSQSLSVLRLLAKPLRVRVSPHGAKNGSTGASGAGIPSIRTLLMPKAMAGTAARSGAGAVPRGVEAAEPAASPAARLRNYLASKVGRKRQATAAPSVSEKRTGKADIRGQQAGEFQDWAAWEQEEAIGERVADAYAIKGKEDARSGRDVWHGQHREVDSCSEAIEAVLLVEPLASIAALEEYIWEKHGGPNRQVAGQASIGSSSSSSSGGGGQMASPGAGGAKRTTGGGAAPPRGGQPMERLTSAAAAARIDVEGDSAPAESPAGNPAAHMRPGGGAEPQAQTAQAQALLLARKKRVQIYLNGCILDAKSSIVQAIVRSGNLLAHRQQPCGGEESESFERTCHSDRFLVTAEEDSSSEDGSTGAGETHFAVPNVSHCCGAIWGRVHSLTYEFVDVKPPASAAGRDEMVVRQTMSDNHAQSPLIGTDFDALVQKHSRIPAQIATLGNASTSSKVATAVNVEEEAAPDGSIGASGEEAEAVTKMLALLSALHTLCEHMRATADPFTEGQADEEDFHCNSLTAKLLRQLSDPLAICTGSIPDWCTSFAGTCRFLFPYSARRILHHSCDLGLSRALHHVQQRTLAQNAHSQEVQRRLEGEVAVANIPRQKVRISRQRIIESAIKVMNLYGTGSTVLEVEYIGEVGTGSGPTLEFYAQVADLLRSSEPRLFREGVPNGWLFPRPLTKDEASEVSERFRLLGQVVAKCILDNRLVDLQLHPLFWHRVLADGPCTTSMLRDVDPELYKNIGNMRDIGSETLAQLCVDFTLPGSPQIELKPGGCNLSVTSKSVDEYMTLVAETTLVTAVDAQVAAFRSAFSELLPLSTCHLWSTQELSSLIVGSLDDAHWSLEQLGSHIKAQHGYQADSRCFRDLLKAMTAFSAEQRRSFLTFVTGAPTLPVNGFAGLKPPLTVVKKESPPAPLTPDQYMPSVMTCANYLKLPEYSSADILWQKMLTAMSEGQSAFHLS